MANRIVDFVNGEKRSETVVRTDDLVGGGKITTRHKTVSPRTVSRTRYKNGKLFSSSSQHIDAHGNVTIQDTTYDTRTRFQRQRDRYFTVRTVSSSVLGIVFVLLCSVGIIRVLFLNGSNPYEDLNSAMNSGKEYSEVYKDTLDVLKSPILGVPSFNTALDFLQDTPQIELDLKDFNDKFQIVQDWGVFNFLRDFINILGSILGFAVWLVSCIINVITMLVYFIGWIFTG